MRHWTCSDETCARIRALKGKTGHDAFLKALWQDCRGAPRQFVLHSLAEGRKALRSLSWDLELGRLDADLERIQAAALAH